VAVVATDVWEQLSPASSEWKELASYKQRFILFYADDVRTSQEAHTSTAS
jgi:hypothetical protein